MFWQVVALIILLIWKIWSSIDVDLHHWYLRVNKENSIRSSIWWKPGESTYARRARYYSPCTLWHTSMILISQGNSSFRSRLPHGHNQIVRYLLERGAQVSVKTSSGANDYHDIYEFTYLYGAACKWDCNSRPYLEQQEERSAFVRSLLLEFWAHPNADAFHRGRPMWMEPMCGVDAIRALIHHGLYLNWHAAADDLYDDYWSLESFDFLLERE